MAGRGEGGAGESKRKGRRGREKGGWKKAERERGRGGGKGVGNTGKRNVLKEVLKGVQLLGEAG